MEPKTEYKEALRRLGEEAKEKREREEEALCGKGESVSVLEWSREWRKKFEGYSLACENIRPSSEKEQ
jgi:hypothetical protein